MIYPNGHLRQTFNKKLETQTALRHNYFTVILTRRQRNSRKRYESSEKRKKNGPLLL